MSVHYTEAQSDVTARRVQAELAPLCGHLNVLHARMVELVAEALAADAWGGSGLRSPEHWLAWQTGLSPARAAAAEPVPVEAPVDRIVTGNAAGEDPLVVDDPDDSSPSSPP